jgi:cyclopropane-fatty-acyl-phospholipid synthase
VRPANTASSPVRSSLSQSPVLDRLLAPGGRVGLQTLTMRHDRMMRTSITYTWIDKYILPGGLIPSVEAMEDALAGHTSLRVVSRDSFGDHYRATLAL